jgi:hypothetical protein
MIDAAPVGCRNRLEADCTLGGPVRRNFSIFTGPILGFNSFGEVLDALNGADVGF